MSMVETWVSVAGSLASICGAVWSFVEARKSSGAATAAERVRDELISRRTLIEISQVHAETARILQTVSAVGPSCNPSLLRGVNTGAIAKAVEEYSRYLNEHSSHFSDDFINKAEELCQGLHPDIESLSEAKSFEDKKAAGKSIYYKISSFMPFVKVLSDQRRDYVSLSHWS